MQELAARKVAAPYEPADTGSRLDLLGRQANRILRVSKVLSTTVRKIQEGDPTAFSLAIADPGILCTMFIALSAQMTGWEFTGWARSRRWRRRCRT